MGKRKDKIPVDSEASLKAMSDAAKIFIEAVGEDPKRDGLKRTPERYAKAFMFLTDGYRKTPEEIVGKGVFEDDCQEMVIVKDIEFYSLCEHHLVPFFGRAHVAYIPNGKIVGLSKIARLVDLYARRLQVQERMTREIGQALNKILKPQGVAVLIEASHLCMMMRGVEKENSKTITSNMVGIFRDDSKTRSEFLSLLNR